MSTKRNIERLSCETAVVNKYQVGTAYVTHHTPLLGVLPYKVDNHFAIDVIIKSTDDGLILLRVWNNSGCLAIWFASQSVIPAWAHISMELD